MAHFLRDNRGSASIEFVVLFPLLFAILMAFLEMGWLMTKHMMLDRGLDVTMRQIRIASAPVTNYEAIRTAICANAFIFSDCEEELKIQLVPVDDVTPAILSSADCYDRGLDAAANAATDYAAGGGGRDQIMFVRVCVLVNPILPGVGYGYRISHNDAGETVGYSMISYSAFMNEPA
ncbi:MAG: TadE/TadG family type IV pilus assembly protein [Pseudomonadota bacterium]